LVLATVLLGLASGCTWGWAAAMGRPEPRGDWDPKRSPAPRAIPGVVSVFQLRGFDAAAIGSGAIVHSCKEHGTYVLTAYHCVDGREPAGVWVYDDDPDADPDADPELSSPGLGCYHASLILPGARPAGVPDDVHQDDGAAQAAERRSLEERLDRVRAKAAAGVATADDGEQLNRLIAEKDWFVFLMTWDFAILKVETRHVFQAMRVYAGSQAELPTATSVTMASVMPEGYPHVHGFGWASTWSPEVFQSGHSGSPILYRDAVFAILAEGAKDLAITDPCRDRPPLTLIREELRKRGFEYLLDPRSPCHGARGASESGG
jgi:hypothetical protein